MLDGLLGSFVIGSSFSLDIQHKKEADWLEATERPGQACAYRLKVSQWY